MKTTLNKIKSHTPCAESWQKLLKSLGKTKADDTEVSIEYILDVLGFEDALWALRAVEGYDREIRLLVCDYAEHVLPVFEGEYPDDNRLRQVIEVARRYANGEATQEELYAAWDAARAATECAWDAARAATECAWDATRAVAKCAWDAAWAATRDAPPSERQWQEQKLRDVLK